MSEHIPDSIIRQAENNTAKSSDASLNKRALTSGMFFVFAQLCVRGLTFLVTPVYTRMLSRAQYGQIRVYESWLLIGYTAMSLCLWRSADVAKYDYKDKFNDYISSVQFLSHIAVIGFFAICMVFRKTVQEFCDMDDLMFYFWFLYVFTYTSMLYLQRRDKQLFHYKFSTAATFLTIIPGTFLSVFLIWHGRVLGLTDQLVSRRVIGYYTPQIIGGAVIAVLLFIQGHKTLFNKQYWAYGLAFSLPLMPEALSIQVMNQSDKIMIQKMIGRGASGIFALATTVSFIIWILEDSVWNAWIPWLYEKISEDRVSEVEKPWIVVMHLFGLLSWILVVMAPEEIRILGPKKYYTAVWLIAPMVSGTLFRFYSYSYSAIQNYYKNTRYVAAGTISTMVLNVILNYVCILHFGYRAAAYTTAISYMVLLIVQGILEHRITGQVIVPLHKTVIIAIFYGLINTVSMLLFGVAWYLRYGLLIIICSAVFIILRKELTGLVGMFKKKR